MTTATLEIDGVSPRERISPRTAEDLAAALKAADDTGQAVAAVGGGTQLDLGMPPLRLDVVVDTTGLDPLATMACDQGGEVAYLTLDGLRIATHAKDDRVPGRQAGCHGRAWSEQLDRQRRQG